MDRLGRRELLVVIVDSESAAVTAVEHLRQPDAESSV